MEIGEHDLLCMDFLCPNPSIRITILIFLPMSDQSGFLVDIPAGPSMVFLRSRGTQWISRPGYQSFRQPSFPAPALGSNISNRFLTTTCRRFGSRPWTPSLGTPRTGEKMVRHCASSIMLRSKRTSSVATKYNGSNSTKSSWGALLPSVSRRASVRV
ncbi:hypothetical protein BC828DRAFT_54889 [Blastocladiella britannica]|nr:hypothetical protein BC828DRAFT_54889 [Blastocladiella britannica]